MSFDRPDGVKLIVYKINVKVFQPNRTQNNYFTMIFP